MSGSSGQNLYMSYQWLAGATWGSAPQNKLSNPLLGIQIPNNDAIYRQVAYYTTNSITLPLTMSSVPNNYSVLSHGVRVGAGSSATSNIPIPPVIFY